MKKSFTLVEAIIIITIVGILIAAIIVGITMSRTRGRDSNRVASIDLVAEKLAGYLLQNKVYPSDCENQDDTNCTTGTFKLLDNENLRNIPEINTVLNSLEDASSFYYMCKRELVGEGGTSSTQSAQTVLRPSSTIQEAFIPTNCGPERADCINDNPDSTNTYLEKQPIGNCSTTTAQFHVATADTLPTVPITINEVNLSLLVFTDYADAGTAVVTPAIKINENSYFGGPRALPIRNQWVPINVSIPINPGETIDNLNDDIILSFGMGYNPPAGSSQTCPSPQQVVTETDGIYNFLPKQSLISIFQQFSGNLPGTDPEKANYINDSTDNTFLLRPLYGDCRSTGVGSYSVKQDGGQSFPFGANTVVKATKVILDWRSKDGFPWIITSDANRRYGPASFTSLRVAGKNVYSGVSTPSAESWTPFHYESPDFSSENVVLQGENNITLQLTMGGPGGGPTGLVCDRPVVTSQVSGKVYWHATTTGTSGVMIRASNLSAQISYTYEVATGSTLGEQDCRQYILKACLESGGGSNGRETNGKPYFKIENSVTGAIEPYDQRIIPTCN